TRRVEQLGEADRAREIGEQSWKVGAREREPPQRQRRRRQRGREQRVEALEERGYSPADRVDRADRPRVVGRLARLHALGHQERQRLEIVRRVGAPELLAALEQRRAQVRRDDQTGGTGELLAIDRELRLLHVVTETAAQLGGFPRRRDAVGIDL